MAAVVGGASAGAMAADTIAGLSFGYAILNSAITEAGVVGGASAGAMAAVTIAGLSSG